MNYNTSPFSETFPAHTRAVTPSTLRSAQAKTALVWLLAWVRAWKPRLAMFLRKLVLRLWPALRRS